MESNEHFSAWMIELAQVLELEHIVSETIDQEAFSSMTEEAYAEILVCMSSRTWF